MKLFGNNKNGMLPEGNGKNGSGKPVKQMTKETRRYAILTLVNTILFVFIYYLIIEVGRTEAANLAAMIIYAVIGAVFIIAYVIYNRGFSLNGVTAEMLPDGWSDEKKQSVLGDAVEHKRKSRWMLTVIIPIIVTFFVDVLYLFLWCELLEPYFSRII